MSNPLRRMVSSSQVSDWFKMGGTLTIPSRNVLLSIESLVIAGGGDAHLRPDHGHTLQPLSEHLAAAA